MYLTHENYGGLDYWLYLPEGYEEKGDWPLLIFLHGRGQTTLEKLLEWGPPKEIEENELKLPFVMVAPLSPNEEWWKTDRLIVFTDSIAEKYKIDLHRIYVTGLSMGGFATWDLVTKFPTRFAAAAPICGGGDPKTAARMKDIPTWVFHGEKDTTVKIERSNEMVEALREAGGNVKYTTFPDEAHVCWPRVYADPEFYNWLAMQRRETPADVEEFAGLSQELRTGTSLKTSSLAIEENQMSAPISLTLTVTNDTSYPATFKGEFKGISPWQFKPATVEAEVPEKGKTEIEVLLTPRGKIRPTALNPFDLHWTMSFDPPAAKPFRYEYQKKFHVTPIYSCESVSKPLTIDALSADWKKEWTLITRLAEITPDPKSHRGPRDCSFRFDTCHDETMLYILIEVQDDDLKLKPDQPVWDQDGVEVRIDARPDDRRTSMNDWDDVLPILVSPPAPDHQQIIWEASRLPENTQISSRATEKGYLVEIAIPKSYLGSARRFRMNIAVNDFDGDDKGVKLWWYPDWRGGNDSGSEGTFELK